MKINIFDILFIEVSFRPSSDEGKEKSGFRPWESCKDATWNKASRRCNMKGKIVGATHGDVTGHWALANNCVIGKYASEIEAQAAVDQKLGLLRFGS